MNDDKHSPQPATDLLPVVRAAAAGLTPEELAVPILVGVSGGPDSLALLHLLWRWALERGGSLRAVQVDHGLRPESGAEAARVAAFCAERQIAVSLRRVEPGAIAAGRDGLEAAARWERYRLFAEEARAHGARVLALGHQADDQAETLLLHLLRGSGLAGLAGMPVVRRTGDLFERLVAEGTMGTRPAVWRPLFGARRAAIEAYCREHGLSPSLDPSNEDLALRRNVVRHRLLPLLEEHFPEATAILARDAQLLADDEDWLQQETERAWAQSATVDREVVLLDRAAFRAAHVALQRRFVRRAWLAVRGTAVALGLSAAAVEAAREGIAGGRVGGRWALPGGVAVLVERETAALGPAATLEEVLRRRLRLPLAEPGWATVIAGPGTIVLPDGWGVRVEAADASHPPASVRHIPSAQRDERGVLALRTWRDGDRIELPGDRGSQKLQDWFVDHHVPRYARRHLVLLAAGPRVLWVAGLAAFAPAANAGQGRDERGGLTLRLLYNGVPVEGERESG